MAAFLGYLLFILALILGALRPAVGLYVLVAFVAVTPSLPWQLGLANLAYPLLYSIGWLLGVAGGQSGAGSPRVLKVGGLRIGAGCTVLFLLVSSILALFREYPLGSLTVPLELGAALANFGVFNPDQLAGFAQALAIPVVGVLLFGAAAMTLVRPRARRLFEAGMVSGALVVCGFLPLQAVLLDPTVRPDKGLADSLGLVGSFHDPHSFAAYLILASATMLGLAAGRAEGRLLPALLVVFLAAALFLSGSRSGMLSAAISLLLFGVAAWLFGDPTLDRRRQRRRTATAIGIASATAIVMLVLALSPAVRTELREELTRSFPGGSRLWELIDPQGAEHPLLARRLLQWEKALVLIEHAPVWGFGPEGYVRTHVDLPEDSLAAYERTYGRDELNHALIELPVENAHNYYLQIASEHGVPALLALLAMIGTIFAVALGALRDADRHTRMRLLGALAGLVGFLVLSLPSHPLLLSEMQALFWTLAAYVVALAVCERDGPQPGPVEVTPRLPA